MKVKVKFGAETFEERECRPVRLPDGREGAVWRGQAFALVDGEIDAAGEGLAPSLCREAAADAGAPAYVVQANYVLLAGSVLDADSAALRLARAGVEVLRRGRYVGEPVPGFDADWFLRVEYEAGEALEARIALALGTPATPAPRGADARERLIAVELERALERARAAKAEIERLKEEAGEIDRFRDDASRERDLAEVERQRREAAEFQAAEAEQRVRELLAGRPQSAPTRAGRRTAEEIDDVLAALLPRIRLVRDTRDTVATEFESRQGFYRALGELERSTQGLPAEWKAVKGASAWIERHVSNGRDNNGRAYARLDKSDRCWNVLVSFKAQQPRDIDWLKRN